MDFNEGLHQAIMDACLDETAHALALLYLQQQDLSSLSPEELCDKYKDAYDRTKTYRKSHKGSKVTVME